MNKVAYGLLGAPLGMAALPLFVQLPAYYATHLGVALAPLGAVLFGARLIDMLQDPLLGHFVDRSQGRWGRAMLFGATVMALAFAALWLPPAGVAPLTWLALMLVLGYGAHSLVNIAYLAWGARIPGSIGAVAWREAAGLAGMLTASVVPAAILAGDAQYVRPGLAAYSLAFAILLALSMIALLRQAPAPTMQTATTTAGWHDALRELAGNRAVRALLLPYLINALSVAIPATLALFFIQDRLRAPEWSGAFLACYFAAAAGGLPAWTMLARRIGPLDCWRLGMLLSVAGFCGAALLGPGDTLGYLAVCIAAGAALGADLALPPVLLGLAMAERPGTGTGFGLFTLLGKLALALAGLSLPVLDWFGYLPGTGGGTALVMAYAVIPCLLKLAALAALGLCGRSATCTGPTTARSIP